MGKRIGSGRMEVGGWDGKCGRWEVGDQKWKEGSGRMDGKWEDGLGSGGLEVRGRKWEDGKGERWDGKWGDRKWEDGEWDGWEHEA